MDAFADLKSESVEQTRSEKYDDLAHLKTCRRADGRSLTFNPVTARAAATACRAAVSLPQAEGSEVVILSITLLHCRRPT